VFSRIILVGNYYDHTARSSQASRDADIESAVSLVERMLASGAEVVFFRPRYSLSTQPLRAAVLAELDQVSVVPMDKSTADWDRAFERLMAHERFTVFDQAGILIQAGCGAKSCFNGHTGDVRPLYRDENHLTDYGAQVVFDKLVRGTHEHPPRAENDVPRGRDRPPGGLERF